MSPLSSLDRNMPILVVDDLSAMRRVLRHCLRKLGFENIVEAENAQAALEHLNGGEFKFVISDWSMEVKGAEFLQTAREHEKLKNVPFLIVTPEAYKNAVLECVKDEDNCIVKPFTADLLKQKMEAILGEHPSSQK